MGTADVGTASLAISQSVSAFQFFLPKLSEVRRGDASTDPDLVGDVRMGEIGAIALSIGVGAILSSLTGSSLPAFVSLLMAGIVVCLYETALRRTKPGNPKEGVAVSRA